MATGIFSVALEYLKQLANEFGLEGKDRTKFLNEECRKIKDAKLEKEGFEIKAEQKTIRIRRNGEAITERT